MSGASSRPTPRPLPGRPDRQIEPVGSYVVFKFTDDIVISENLYSASFTVSADASRPDDEEVSTFLDEHLGWDQLVKEFAPFSFGRAYESLNWEQWQALRERASTITRDENDPVGPMPKLDSFFRFDFAQPTDDVREALTHLVEILNQSDAVEVAHVGGEIEAPPQVNVYEGVFNNPNAGGIGIKAIQGKPKYKGKGADGWDTWFVDVEQGWYHLHPDLPTLPGAIPISGVSREMIWSKSQQKWINASLHGQMVLGLIVAKNNKTGVTGIAPAATPFLASEWRKEAYTPFTPNTASAIMKAITTLGAGDVILLEGQQGAENVGSLPIEANIDILAAIKTAYAVDIIVIEAAGNNFPQGLDLDKVKLPDQPDLFKQQSGAIIVAAGSNNQMDIKFKRRATSNYGTKVDCFADGDVLWVLDPPGAAGDSPESIFELPGGGTSTAAAIIAGVALVLQGIARYNGGYIRPKVMRRLLSDKNTGTLPDPLVRGENIGAMPDLIRMETTYTSLTDLYKQK